jgi:hypothetical protein
MRLELQKKDPNDACAPLTSFDWNELEPHIIGTSSIGTTCTIWDINVRVDIVALPGWDVTTADACSNFCYCSKQRLRCIKSLPMTQKSTTLHFPVATPRSLRLWVETGRCDYLT